MCWAGAIRDPNGSLCERDPEVPIKTRATDQTIPWVQAGGLQSPSIPLQLPNSHPGMLSISYTLGLLSGTKRGGRGLALDPPALGLHPLPSLLNSRSSVNLSRSPWQFTGTAQLWRAERGMSLTERGVGVKLGPTSPGAPPVPLAPGQT